MPRNSTIRRHAARIAREIHQIKGEGLVADIGSMDRIRSLVLLDWYADDLKGSDLRRLVAAVEIEYQNLERT